MFNDDLWSRFSNHHDDLPPGLDVDPSEQLPRPTKHSLEFAHDQVHVIVGGYGGHMRYPDIAGFDPIFFFHHTNVDRLCALWQAAHPEAWIKEGTTAEGTRMKPPGATENEHSLLYPFRKQASPNEEFWTSAGVRYVTDLGYTYPELEDIKDLRKIDKTRADKMKQEMRLFYHPMQFEQSRVYLTVSGVDKFAFRGS